VNEVRRSKLLGKYTAKLLFGWNNKKFKKEYLKKLERNWDRYKNEDRKTNSIICEDKEASSSGSRILKER